MTRNLKAAAWLFACVSALPLAAQAQSTSNVPTTTDAAAPPQSEAQVDAQRAAAPISQTPTPGAEVTPTPATSEDPNTVDEVIVTATRRAQNLQDVPIAISAVDGDTLQDQQVSDLLELQGLVPGLQINRNNAVVTLTMRGVGTNFRVQGVDTTVALHTDGVYISSSNAAQAAFFDVERLEVVRGPQGVLYGRNASGGAVNIITRQPTREFGGYATATYGNYNALELETAFGGPIVEDRVLYRVGAYRRTRDGFGENFTTGEDNQDLDEWGVRGVLQFIPTDRLNVFVRADYYHGDDNSTGTEALPGSAPGRARTCLPTPAACAPGRTRAETLGGVIATTPRDSFGNVQTERDLHVYGAALEAVYEINDQLTFKSLTGARYVDSYVQTDQDQTRLSVNDPFQQTVTGGQFSQEFQLNYDGERFYAVAGAYYFREKRNATTLLAFPALDFLPAVNFGDVFQRGNNQTEAMAVFGNVDIDLTDTVTLGVGARFSTEEKSTEGNNVTIFGPLRTIAEVEETFEAFTPRVTLTWEPRPELTVFGSISRGFKSGQFALATPAFARPEILIDYEGGVRGRLFDGAVRYSLGAFYYDFEDVQLQLFSGPVNSITNAPSANAYGVEFALDWALPNDFRFHVDITYEQSEYEGLITDNPNTGLANQDLSGFSFPYTPEWSYVMFLEKDVNWGRYGTGTFRIEDQFNGDTFLDIYNSRVNGFREDHHIINASYRHDFDERWSAVVWGRNLGDEDVIQAANFGTGQIGLTRLVNFNPPRTYGVSLTRNF